MQYLSGHALRGRGSRNEKGSIEVPVSIGHALRGRGSRNRLLSQFSKSCVCHALRGRGSRNRYRQIAPNNLDSHALRGRGSRNFAQHGECMPAVVTPCEGVGVEIYPVLSGGSNCYSHALRGRGSRNLENKHPKHKEVPSRLARAWE